MKAQRKTKTRNTLSARRGKKGTKKKQRVMKRQRQKGGSTPEEQGGSTGSPKEEEKKKGTPGNEGGETPPANPPENSPSGQSNEKGASAGDANPTGVETPPDGPNKEGGNTPAGSTDDTDPQTGEEKGKEKKNGKKGKKEGQDGASTSERPEGQDGQDGEPTPGPGASGGQDKAPVEQEKKEGEDRQDDASASGTSETPEATASETTTQEATAQGGQVSANPNEGQDCEEQTRLFTTRLMELEGYVRYYNTRIQEISKSAGTAKDQLGQLKEFIEGIQNMFESLQRMEPMMAPNVPGITPGQMTGIPAQPRTGVNLGGDLEGQSTTEAGQANVSNANVNAGTEKASAKKAGTEKAKGNVDASANGNVDASANGNGDQGPSIESKRGTQTEDVQSAGSIDAEKLQEIIELFRNVQACDYGIDQCSANKTKLQGERVNTQSGLQEEGVNAAQSGGSVFNLVLRPNASKENLVTQSIDYLQEILNKLEEKGNESLKNLVNAAIFCSVGNNYYRQFLNIDDMVKFFSVGADGSAGAGSILLGEKRFEKSGSVAPSIPGKEQNNAESSTTVIKRMYNFLLDYERFYKILDDVTDSPSANLNEIIQRCYKFGFIIRFGYLILFMIYFFVDNKFNKINVSGNDPSIEIIQKYFSRLSANTIDLNFIGDNNELISVHVETVLDGDMFTQYTYPYHNYKMAIAHLKQLPTELGVVINIEELYKTYFKVEFGELGNMIKNAIQKNGTPGEGISPFNQEVEQLPNTDAASPAAALQYIIKKNMYNQVFTVDVTQLLEDQQTKQKVRMIDDNEDPTYFDIVYKGLDAIQASEGFGPNNGYSYVPLPKQQDYFQNESNIQTPEAFFSRLFKPKAVALTESDGYDINLAEVPTKRSKKGREGQSETPTTKRDASETEGN